MKRSAWLCCFAIFCAMVAIPLASALAEIPAAERVLITDPQTLESTGFPANAKNVYRWTGVSAPVITTEDSPLVPNDFGPGYDYTTLAPKEFIGRQDTTGSAWAWDGGGEGCCTNLSRRGSEPFADAVVHLPTGARLAAIRWWANDVDASNDMAFFVFETCHPGFAAGPTITTEFASASPATSGSTGNQSGLLTFVSLPFYIDNMNCRYTARVRFDATDTLTLQKIRFQWVREVSPAPATATFIDVPTTHPFFQFVEALAAAGITGGCGGGKFCPESPLTRGQMAVFLSSALGLSWP